jgi:hypothetical protein
MDDGTHRATILGVALPAVLVAMLFGVSGAAALVVGRPLLWAPSDLTLAEAVGLRDQGEAVRLIMLGANPNRSYDMRDVFRDDEHIMLTPLEAAVITREDYMLELVLAYGARIDDANAATLQCLAQAVAAETIKTYIIERSREIECRGVPLPWSP